MPDATKRPYLCVCGHELNDHRDHVVLPDEPCRKCGCRDFHRAPRIGDILRKHTSRAASAVDEALAAVEDSPYSKNERVSEAYGLLIEADLRLKDALAAVGDDPGESDPMGVDPEVP